MLTALLFLSHPCSPAGTWQDTSNNALACKSCTDWPVTGVWTYRNGDAAPENNECRRVPSGARSSLKLRGVVGRCSALEGEGRYVRCCSRDRGCPACVLAPSGRCPRPP